jgi:hypothetical protein
MKTSTSLLERQLLLSAKASDLGSIINIVKDLSVQEKSSISPKVLDTVVESIIHYATFDRAESAYTMMLFVRAVGPYISPTSMTAMLQAIPPAMPRATAVTATKENTSATNVRFLRDQSA